MKACTKILTKIVLLLLLSSISCSQENGTIKTVDNKNVAIVKKMFSEFAESLDINKLDQFFSKDLVLKSNDEYLTYTQYKELEKKNFSALKSLKVKYDDIFNAGDKVISRLSINLISKKGKKTEFQVIIIALIKQNKIDKIWELTYPDWD